MNPAPSFLLCTPCRAQPPSPAASQLFVLISLSRSLPPFLWYLLSSSGSPANSPSRFPPASPASRLRLSALRYFNAALSSLALPGEVIERPEGRVPAPRAGAGTGCRRGCSCWGRGAGRQCTCSHSGLRAGAAVPVAGEILVGNSSQTLPSPKITLPTEFQGFVPKQLGTHTQNKTSKQHVSWNLREIATYFSFLFAAMR